jgi:hypothetical protein
VAVPELRTVVERSRQRGSRRRRQLGAVAAVLVVGATIPLLRTALRPIEDRAVPPAAATATTDPSASAPLPGPFIYSLTFADERHGFALRGNCGPENNAECTSDLLVTEDGTSWTTRKLPPAIGHTVGSVTGQVFTFGPRTLLVGEIYRRSSPRFFSTDAGQTWQELQTTDDELIDTIPAGA